MAGAIVRRRASGLWPQAAALTPATLVASAWMNWAMFGDTPYADIAQDDPEFMNYSLWVQMQLIPLTKVVRWQMVGRVDTTQFGLLLAMICGAPTGSGPYVFTPGASCQLGTLWHVNNTLSTYYRITDAIMSELEWAHDVTSGIAFTAAGMGLLDDRTATPPTPALRTPADLSPLHPKWAYVTRGGVANPVISAKIKITAQIDPFFDTPSAAMGSSTPEGIDPSDWQIESLKCAFDIRYKYTAFAASSIYAFEHNSPEAYVLAIVDPVTAGARGLTITLPNVKYSAGKEDDKKARSVQELTGAALYSPGISSGVSFSVVPDSTWGGYAAT